MSVYQRFYVEKVGYVGDRLNSDNDRLATVLDGVDSTDQDSLCQLILFERLEGLLADLIFPQRLKAKTGCYRDKRWEDLSRILTNVLAAIGATNLRKKRKKKRALSQQCDRYKPRFRYNKIQGFTSLALFAVDVEGLLRDLYGKLDKTASNNIRHAIISIIMTMGRSALVDLVKEHEDARTLDDGPGGLMALGYGLSSSDSFEMKMADNRLNARAKAVQTNPTEFSKYTVRFIKILDTHWPLRDKALPEESDEETVYHI